MRCSTVTLTFVAAELALQVVAASSGCGTTPNLSAGLNSMDVNGQNREYIIQTPENYDPSTPHKFVLGYHWRDGTMDDVVNGGFYGLSYLAADVPTIFVAPQGIDNGWANTNGDDITFTDQIVEAIETNFCIDQERRFATGWSWGGGMSYSVACSRADVFRAVAVLSGAEISGCDGGDVPIAYFGQHGVSDSVLPIDLGRGLRDHYVEVNGCDPADPPEPSAGSGTHTVTDYSNCSEGHPVQWVAFDGDHEPTPSDAGSQDSFTPGLIWEFFSQF
ncbi:Alpha/Beta hydrolase protein [Aspergillus ambiguus]|uniref:alpha/beta hydrolase family esterase n=1 Tax=Aspergillus ambiguus TaxID=176160 RepID=UPI003CCD0124